MLMNAYTNISQNRGSKRQIQNLKWLVKKGEESFPEFSPFFNSVSRFKVKHRKLIQIRDTLTTLILKLKQKAYIIMNRINL